MSLYLTVEDIKDMEVKDDVIAPPQRLQRSHKAICMLCGATTHSVHASVELRKKHCYECIKALVVGVNSMKAKIEDRNIDQTLYHMFPRSLTGLVYNYVNSDSLTNEQVEWVVLKNI